MAAFKTLANLIDNLIKKKKYSYSLGHMHAEAPHHNVWHETGVNTECGLAHRSWQEVEEVVIESHQAWRVGVIFQAFRQTCKTQRRQHLVWLLHWIPRD